MVSFEGPVARSAGPGLGIAPAAPFGSASVTLEPGDALLPFTDGVTEAMGGSERMFGTERLEAVLRGTGAAGGAQHLMTAVREAVDVFVAGAEQYDDVTMLGFRRTR